MAFFDSASVGKGLAAIILITVIVLAIGFFLPAGVTSYTANSTSTFIQETNNEEIVFNTLHATITDINQESNEVTVELQNARTFDNTTTTITEGDSENVPLNGEVINVKIDSIRSDSTARITYIYSATFGYPNSAVRLLGMLDVLIVIVSLVAIMLWGLGFFE